MQTLAIPGIPWQDYRDYSGFNDASKYRIGETQVIAAQDSGLANATSTLMDQLYSSPAFIGIDP